MKPETRAAEPKLDLSKWRNVPIILIGAGGLLTLIGVPVLVAWLVKLLGISK